MDQIADAVARPAPNGVNHSRFQKIDNPELLMDVEGQGQGLVRPPNPMRASEESTEQRLDRWQKLRDHLRDVGLSKDPPDGLLLEQEPTTRPDVPLVAYYDKVKQVSFGKSRLAVVGIIVRLAAFASVWVLGWFADIEGRPIPLWSMVLGVVLLWVFVEMVIRTFESVVVRKDELCLTLEELSLSLPDGRRHARWRDVYSVSVTKRGKRFNRQWPWVRRVKEPHVRVELDDGVAARLYPDAAECEPLADLMRDFVIHHRGDHAAALQAVLHALYPPPEPPPVHPERWTDPGGCT